MNEQEIRRIFEEIDPKGQIPQSMLEEFVAQLKLVERGEGKENHPDGANVSMLREQLATESDWRKRTSIAAKIISLNLSE